MGPGRCRVRPELGFLCAGVTLVLVSGPVCAQEPPQTTSRFAQGSVTRRLEAWNSRPSASGTVAQPTPASPGLVAGVTLGELYTTNVTLAQSAQEKRSSYITQAGAFLRAARSGPRLSGLIDYNLTGYLYRGQEHQKQLVNDLHADGTFTILPRHFFIDGLASYERQTIRNELPAAQSSFFLSGNQANSAVAVLSPYWSQDLGALGSATLRYSRGRVVYDVKGIPGEESALLGGTPDATSNGLQFALDSPTHGLWRWSLSYAHQRIEPDFGPDQEFAAAKLGLGLQLTREFELLADGGKENEFLPDGTYDTLGARFWDAGFRWSNARNVFEVLAGHHFYGPSYTVSWSHQAARVMTSLSYQEETTDLNRLLLNRDPTQAVLLPMSVPRAPSLTELQPYVSKRGTASLSYVGARDKLTLTAYDEYRNFFDAQRGDERILDAQLSWAVDIGAFTTLTPTYGWQRYRFQSGQITYRYFWELALVHAFGRHNTGSIDLRSDIANVYAGIAGAHGYRANQIFLQWTHLF